MTHSADLVRLVVEAFERYGQENPGQTWDCFGPEFAARLAVEAMIDGQVARNLSDEGASDA